MPAIAGILIEALRPGGRRFCGAAPLQYLGNPSLPRPSGSGKRLLALDPRTTRSFLGDPRNRRVQCLTGSDPLTGQ
jgi:hypothetical protein